MNATIASITLRALIGRRRFLLLLPLPVLLVLLTIFAKHAEHDPAEWGEPVLLGFGLGMTLPLVALVVGTGVIALEIDDGTLPHLLAKPLPRRVIVLTKLVVATAVAATVTGIAMFVAGTLTDGLRLGAGVAVAAAAGALIYSALFFALSLVTRRPVLAGLLYVLLWEGLLGAIVSGTGVLSVQRYATAIAARASGSDLFSPSVSLPVAVTMSVVVVLGCTVVAIERLKSFTVAGETG